MIGDVLPKGYRFDIDPNGVAHAVLGKSTWAVLALTLAATFPRAAAPTVTIDASAPAGNVNPALLSP